MRGQAVVEYLVLLGVTLFLGSGVVGLLVLPIGGSGSTVQAQSDLQYMIGAMRYPELGEGLVAYYKLDEESGAVAYNVAGSELDGTLLNGTEHTQGKSGKAAKFDGIDDHINCGNSKFEFGNRPHAYSVWINISSLPNAYNYVLATGNNNVGEQSGIGVVDNGNFFVSAFGIPIEEFNAPVLGTNAWHHIVFVYDGSRAHLYVDGQRIDSKTIALNTSVGKCRMGSHTGDSSFFRGGIDDVRIYSRSLSEHDIELLFNNPGFP